MARNDSKLYPRGKKKREAIKTILIICEGEETERTYFQQFRSRKSGVRIEFPRCKNTDPLGLIKYSELMKEQYDINTKYGDSVWCVFDVDNHSNTTLEKAVRYAENVKVNTVISNPCFELWYLLHYIYTTRYFKDCDDVIRILNSYLSGYSKEKDYNSQLSSNLNKALEHSERLIDYHIQQGNNLFLRESNPVTHVKNLAKYLRDLQ